MAAGGRTARGIHPACGVVGTPVPGAAAARRPGRALGRRDLRLRTTRARRGATRAHRRMDPARAPGRRERRHVALGRAAGARRAAARRRLGPTGRVDALALLRTGQRGPSRPMAHGARATRGARRPRDLVDRRARPRRAGRHGTQRTDPDAARADGRRRAGGAPGRRRFAAPHEPAPAADRDRDRLAARRFQGAGGDPPPAVGSHAAQRTDLADPGTADERAAGPCRRARARQARDDGVRRAAPGPGQAGEAAPADLVRVTATDRGDVEPQRDAGPVRQRHPTAFLADGKVQGARAPAARGVRSQRIDGAPAAHGPPAELQAAARLRARCGRTTRDLGSGGAAPAGPCAGGNGGRPPRARDGSAGSEPPGLCDDVR